MTTERKLRTALASCAKALPVLRTMLLSDGLAGGSDIALGIMLEVQAALALPETPVQWGVSAYQKVRQMPESEARGRVSRQSFRTLVCRPEPGLWVEVKP